MSDKIEETKMPGASEHGEGDLLSLQEEMTNEWKDFYKEIRQAVEKLRE